MFAGQLVVGTHLRAAHVASFLDRPQTPDSNPFTAPVSDDARWGLFADGVRLIALRALGDPELADDVAQEAVTRAIASLASERDTPIADLGGFVYGIARHLIADVHRARGRTLPVDSIPEPVEPSPGALDATIAHEDRERVRLALAELETPDRDLLRLYFVDGLDADAIGKRLGETAVNIRKRKSRALERLRRLFGRHDSTLPATNTR